MDGPSIIVILPWVVGSLIAVIGVVITTIWMIASDKSARLVALAILVYVGVILILAKVMGGE